LLVKEAVGFVSEITVACGEKQADGKKIFSLMGLGAKQGDLLQVTVDGEDEDAAALALEKLAGEFI